MIWSLKEGRGELVGLLRMEPDPAAEYLIDDAGDVGAGSDGELRCAIESLCGMSPSSG